eukprot:gb/GFBE01011930.1/.p1 GENE.gb/GFBE01011930.1/~~gb/GFBE01011930.1/.p1  ORF type:complete len:964 (+),score=177.86 gb/GFBE01011930.1/:1-2892(+)
MEKLKSLKQKTTAPAVNVVGAGSPDANGTYVRTGTKVAGSDVFQKPGTRLAVLKRGEDASWSIVDLGGKPTGSVDQHDYSPMKTSVSYEHSRLGNSLLRWRPQSIVLYQVGSLLHSRSMPLPPEVGWLAVEGVLPVPQVGVSEKHVNALNLLKDHLPGKLLHKVASAAPTAAKVSASIYKPWRTASEPTLPPVDTLRSSDSFGSFESPKKALPKISKARRTLPVLGSAMRSSRQGDGVAGELSMVYFTVLLKRPSFHTDWGTVFDAQELASTGRRVICDVERNSPLDRWNTWQTVRGRDDLCVRPGDQLLKFKGMWALTECPMESAEGFESFPDAPTQGFAKPPGVGETSLFLEFGRLMRRPPIPSAPRLEGWEVGHGLRVDIDNSIAGEYQHDVIAWAVVLKEDIPMGTLGSGPSGKPETCWHVYDGKTGKVRPAVRGQEVASVSANHEQCATSILLGVGIKSGRTYSACVAMLTNAGWSAFSQCSRSVHIRKLPGPAEGVLSITLPKEDEQLGGSASSLRLLKRSGSTANEAPLFVLPQDMQPGFTSPISSASTHQHVAELLGRKRLLMMQMVLKHGRPKGLRVSCNEGGGSTLLVEAAPKVTLDESEKTSLKLSGLNVELGLREGDFIVRINGITGGMPMVQELARDPPVITLELLRAAGGKTDEAAQVFPLNSELDEDCNKTVEEIRAHGIYNIMDAELAMLLVGNRDDLIEQALKKARSVDEETVRRIASKPSDTSVATRDLEDLPDNLIMKDAQRRILVLRRFAMVSELTQTGNASAEAQTQLSEACRLLQWAMADACCDPEMLSSQVENFKRTGAGLIRASQSATALLKRALFQVHLWFWRKHLREIRQELKESVDEMLRLEKLDRENLEKGSGHELPPEVVSQIVDARNDLHFKVASSQDFRSVLVFDVAEAEAVYKRNSLGHRMVFDAAGNLQDEKSCFNPQKTLSLGEKLGWW